MKLERPQFELTRVYADGTQDAPEIIPVTQMPWDTRMGRRGFMGVGVGLATVLVLSASACSSTRKAHSQAVGVLAISSDGKTLASVSIDNTIKLWSFPDGKLLTTLEGQKELVRALTISPNRRQLASGSWDKTINLWSLPEGKLLTTLRGHQNVVSALAISTDGKILASGASDLEDNPIKLWSLPEGEILAEFGGWSSAEALAISLDGNILASASDGLSKLWALPERKLLATLSPSYGGVRVFVISPDGKLLASGHRSGSINLWSLPDGKHITTLQEDWYKDFRESVDAIVICPDGKTLVSGYGSGAIRLWSLPDGKRLDTLEEGNATGRRKSISALAISLDGKILASGNMNREIILWDLESKNSRTTLFDPQVNQSEPSFPSDSSSCPSHSSGGGCTCNKVCTCIPVPSDRNVKEAFETTDPLLILQRLSELPIQTWNYKWNDASVRHIGPMAQDFAATFAVGEDDKHICPVDAQGVAFAAIQGLYWIVKEKDAQTESLQVQLQKQQAENQELKARLEALEHLIKPLV